jgi:dipeptidyl-peptidase-4
MFRRLTTSDAARTTLALVLAALATCPPARAEDLLDQYAATDRFRAGLPRNEVVTPDGAEVLYLRSGPRDRVGDLYAFDTRTGHERVLLTARRLLGGAAEALTPEELARRERLRSSARGIASFALSRDGRRLLVPLSGRLYVLERADGSVRELPAGGGTPLDARFSPDGEHVACVRDGDLCVIDLATNAQRTVLAHDGERVTWGLPEFVAQEEMDRFEGYWWSPDSRALLVQRTDESRVERLSIADPAHPERAPQEWAYPRPGRTNADVRLAIVPAAGGPPRALEWDRARYPYLCVAGWPEQGPVTLVVMDRAQREEAVLAADSAGGAARPLFVERDPAWLDLVPGVPRWLPGGRELLWIAERDDSGPWLERRAARGGAPVRLTPPGLRVRSLLGVDEARSLAWVVASDDPTEEHVWAVDVRGRRAPERLGHEAGLETATFSRDGRVRVRTLRPERGATSWRVEDARGQSLGTLPSVGEAPLAEPDVQWLTVGPDSLRACIVRPRNFDPRRRYPVIDWAYAGPHVNQVARRARNYVLPQFLADQGFVVVAIDGRGTPARGRTWERAILGDLAGPALADHEQGLRALCARMPQLDPERIGVIGWSFGGYYTVMALERAPALYRAGVAGAPVVDWRDYDTFYTERYLGQPGADSSGYARSSALTDAARLARPLLVIHGTADDNVYFFHSLKLGDALNAAGRDWKLLPLPGQTHSPGDIGQLRQVYSRAAEFFRRELGSAGDAAPQNP